MKIRPNKVIVGLVAGAFALAILPRAQAAAIPVTNGGAGVALAANGAALSGATLVNAGSFLLNQPFNSGSGFTGTVSTWVVNDTENPAGYTFVYQIHNTSPADVVSGIGIGKFPGFTTAIGNNFTGGGGGLFPSLVGSFPAISGDRALDGVNFTWVGVGGTDIPPGGSSSYIVVETDAHNYVASTAAPTDTTDAFANDLAPAPVKQVVPDGGCTLMLLGSALSGLAFLRRKVS